MTIDPSALAAAALAGADIAVVDGTATIVGAGHTIVADAADVAAALRDIVDTLGVTSRQLRDADVADDERRRARAVTDAVARLEALDAADFGLVDVDGTWTHPDWSHVIVERRIDRVPFLGDATLVLEIRGAGTPVALWFTDSSGKITVVRRGVERPVDASQWVDAGHLTRSERSDNDPTGLWENHTGDTVADLCAAAADPALTAVFATVDELCAASVRRDTEEAERRARVEAEWLAESRTRERIGTKALDDWVRKSSRLDYAANGAVIGGTRVKVDILAGGTRPNIFESRYAGRRKTLPGPAKYYQVVRLTHAQGSGNQFADWAWFYESDVDELRATLGDGCVVTMTEDRRAIFVAYNRPDLVELADAAAVEWTLTARPAD